VDSEREEEAEEEEEEGLFKGVEEVAWRACVAVRERERERERERKRERERNALGLTRLVCHMFVKKFEYRH